MDVVMTGNTGIADISEFPLIIRFMTGNTRRSQMGSFERESGFFMLFPIKTAEVKTGRGVTRGTVSIRGIFKFAFVEILMTLFAGIVWQRCRHKGFFMAFAAIDGFVFSGKYVAGQLVVKIIQFIFYGKVPLGMTAAAIIAKLIFMAVLMTGQA
jgi:hypothetical protein